jgi:membrane-bound metal-dependent hydrolase YbcI (DUF457 family)
MDPVSHAVIGRAVAAAVRPRDARARGVAAASIVGALLPDADLVLTPFGWDVYLRGHVIGTHTVMGALLTGLTSALLIRLIIRRTSLPILTAAAVPAAFSHLLADVVAGGRLRLMWPLHEAVVSAPLVAMGDPYPVIVLLAGVVAMWRWRERLPRAARAMLLALGLLFAVKSVLLWQVLSGPAASPRIDRATRILEARWGSLTGWLVFDRAGGELQEWQVSAGESEPRLVMTLEGAGESPLVRQSRALQSVRNFLAVHELGFAREESSAAGREVLWSDIRYCSRDRGRQESRCALWFGGLFDRAGRAVSQEVRVGSWIQRRAP